MKFTEEQYHEIINIWNNVQDFDDTILSVSDYARKLNARLNYEYGDDVYDYSEAILLALPNSRYWAREEFVEKEKRYVWRTQTINGVRYVLVKKDGVYSMKDLYSHYYEAVPLTETEVKSLKFLDFSELYPEEVE